MQAQPKIFIAFAEVFPASLHYAADRGSMDHTLALLRVKNILMFKVSRIKLKHFYIFHWPDRAPIHAFQRSKISVFPVGQVAYS